MGSDASCVSPIVVTVPQIVSAAPQLQPIADINTGAFVTMPNISVTVPGADQ